MTSVIQQVATLYDQARSSQGIFDAEGKARTQALGEVLEILKKAPPQSCGSCGYQSEV